MILNLENLRTGAAIVSNVLLELAGLIRTRGPEITTALLDAYAEKRLQELGAVSFNKGYHPKWAKTPYPATLCVSINEEICHGVPGPRQLREGDIVTLDLGLKYKDACADAALTVPVGKVENRKSRLLRYTYRALQQGIKEVRAGASVSIISQAIDRCAMQNGYTTIKEFGGHGIGLEMHEKPAIPNSYDRYSENNLLEEGQAICIEPMLTPGTGRVGMDKDEWTIFCMDNQPCAMFEDMILVKKDGYEVLTHHLK